MSRGKPVRIRWGDTYEKALQIGYPLDEAKAYSKPRAGSEFVQSPSGVEDAWIVGYDQFLAGVARWLPAADRGGPPAQTGWDGTRGFGAFLEWAWKKNVLKVHPDGRNLLLTPTLRVDTDANGVPNDWERVIEEGLEAATGGVHSTDGTWVNINGNTAGGTRFAFFRQNIRGVIGGGQYCASVVLETGGLANGIMARIAISGSNEAGTPGLGHAETANVIANQGPTRISVAFNPPVGVIAAQFAMLIEVPAGGASDGTFHFKDAMLEVDRSTASSTLIESPSMDCYLVSPGLDEEPDQENDFLRRVPLLLRSTDGSVFTGY